MNLSFYSNIKRFFYLMFSSKKFLKESKKYQEYKTQERKLNKKRKENGDPPHFKNVRKKRKKILRSINRVFLAIFMGGIVAGVLNLYLTISLLIIQIIRALSIGFIAFAVLMRISPNELTWGPSLIDEVDKSSFWFFYIIGVFMASLSVFLT